MFLSSKTTKCLFKAIHHTGITSFAASTVWTNDHGGKATPERSTAHARSVWHWRSNQFPPVTSLYKHHTTHTHCIVVIVFFWRQRRCGGTFWFMRFRFWLCLQEKDSQLWCLSFRHYFIGSIPNQFIAHPTIRRQSLTWMGWDFQRLALELETAHQKRVWSLALSRHRTCRGNSQTAPVPNCTVQSSPGKAQPSWGTHGPQTKLEVASCSLVCNSNCPDFGFPIRFYFVVFSMHGACSVHVNTCVLWCLFQEESTVKYKSWSIDTSTATRNSDVCLIRKEIFTEWTKSNTPDWRMEIAACLLGQFFMFKSVPTGYRCFRLISHGTSWKHWLMPEILCASDFISRIGEDSPKFVVFLCSAESCVNCSFYAGLKSFTMFLKQSALRGDSASICFICSCPGTSHKADSSGRNLHFLLWSHFCSINHESHIDAFFWADVASKISVATNSCQIDGKIKVGFHQTNLVFFAFSAQNNSTTKRICQVRSNWLTHAIKTAKRIFQFGISPHQAANGQNSLAETLDQDPSLTVTQGRWNMFAAQTGSNTRNGTLHYLCVLTSGKLYYTLYMLFRACLSGGRVSK